MPLHIHRKRRKGAYPILLAGSSFGGYVAMHLRTEKTFAAFERERYNETVKALRAEIKDLEHENAYLNRIIKKLTKQKRKK